EIQQKLDDILAQSDDRALFKRPPPADANVSVVVRGSEVLRRLYWETTTSEYDKVSDGKRLAELARAHKPELLQPLRETVGELGGLSHQRVASPVADD